VDEAVPKEVDEPVAPATRRFSPTRFAAVFGTATAIGQASQFLWLVAGARTMSAADFGTVLAAQALYGLLQYVVDNGPAFYGARLAARGGLDDAARGPLARVRLQASALAAAAALAIGAAGGASFLVAVAPFAVALGLFALFGYWERFGLGESGPWSAYVAARGAAPALAAVAILAAGGRFPLVLAGVLECAVIVGVSLAFALRPLRTLRLAFQAPPGPWRETMVIGGPTMVAQVGLASGTVLLGVTGATAAAAVLAVSVRLLTGLNQLSGLVATSLFPRLARGDETARGNAGVVSGMQLVFVLTTFATAVLLVEPGLFVRLFLSYTTREAEATAILTLATAAAVGYLLVVTMLLIARGLERIVLTAYAAGTSIILAGGVAVVAVSPARPALAMAAVFAAGQLAGVLVLARRTARALPELRAAARAGAAGAVAVAVVGTVAASAPSTARPLALLLAAAGLALAYALVVRRRRR
jgi:O-antigen/teichoic acid export membrane protein